MENAVRRSITEPLRGSLSWDERWRGRDRGLIHCWELGRQQAERDPELAVRATCGELPILGWKGGVEKKLKTRRKYGTLFYLATWQGLRGEDLHVDLGREVTHICSKTGMHVIFTADASKYADE